MEKINESKCNFRRFVVGRIVQTQTEIRQSHAMNMFRPESGRYSFGEAKTRHKSCHGRELKKAKQIGCEKTRERMRYRVHKI